MCQRRTLRAKLEIVSIEAATPNDRFAPIVLKKSAAQLLGMLQGIRRA
jgi:hypothetical protein